MFDEAVHVDAGELDERAVLELTRVEVVEPEATQATVFGTDSGEKGVIVHRGGNGDL